VAYETRESDDHFGWNIWPLSGNIIYNFDYFYVQQWMICGDSAVQDTVVMRFINYGDIVKILLCKKCKNMSHSLITDR
jgi:hypothetical protein